MNVPFMVGESSVERPSVLATGVVTKSKSDINAIIKSSPI